MDYKKLNDYELVSRINESEEITEILFKKYEPLIKNIAKRHYREADKYYRFGIDINDLISEGMVGLSIAVNTYNEHNDTTFFTYANTCINNKMMTYIKGLNRKKYNILNNALSIETLKEELNMSPDKINIIGSFEDPQKIFSDVENVNNLIRKIADELTPFENQVFELKKSGFTYKEISEVLDVDIKKIDYAIQRIKRKIKFLLTK